MKLGFTTGNQILKKRSMQWKHPGSPPPKKFRTQPSASKVMATVFWDSKGIILIDYKPAGTSIKGEYYANIIKQLRVAIKEKRRGKLAAGVLLLHDNAPVHKSRVAQAAIHECKFEQLNHRHTVQTWPQVIINCFEIWSPTCVEQDFGTMMSSRLLQRLGLRTK